MQNKHINIGQEKNILSAKDINDINKCLSLQINIFSFVIHKVENVIEIKDIIGEEEIKNVIILACLESKESIINFDLILKEVDGIILNDCFRKIKLDHKEVNCY